MKHEEEFIKMFNDFTRSRDWHSAFRDFTEMTACAMHQSPYHSGILKRDSAFEKIEKDYLDIVGKYKRDELDILCNLFAITKMALIEKPHDFLGGVYQKLEMNNKHNGEFFTPIHISELMAKMLFNNPEKEIQEKGYIEICEPCCGSGVMLIAAANTIFESGFNPIKTMVFHATDINRICFNMCYIQMSLLGIAGKVIHGDTIKNEIWETRLTPNVMVRAEEAKENGENHA